jgi:hypothetical protein
LLLAGGRPSLQSGAQRGVLVRHLMVSVICSDIWRSALAARDIPTAKVGRALISICALQNLSI